MGKYYSERSKVKKKTNNISDKKIIIKRVSISALVAVVIAAIIALLVINSKVNLFDIIRVRLSQKKVIVIDPGHGGKDPGCGNGNPYEKEITLEVLKEVNKSLKLAGYEVVMTREDDTFLELYERVVKSRAYNADAFVSVHLNWSDNAKANGIETYCNSKLNAKSYDLARCIHKEVLDETEAFNRNVRSDSDYYVVRNSKVPSVLIEIGFLSSRSEGENLTKKAYQKRIAKGITKGIIDFTNQK